MAVHIDTEPGRRPRGRPQKPVDSEKLLATVEQIFVNGGFEAVSIERVAKEMEVSRATLYRSIGSKEELLGLLFTRMTEELTVEALEATKEDGRTAGERLTALLRVQIAAAVRMREYLFVFFGGGWLQADVYANWRRWRRDYEQIWVRTVAAAIEEGDLETSDPVVSTRLLIGMCMWISRWYRPEEGLDPERIHEEAIRLLGRIGP